LFPDEIEVGPQEKKLVSFFLQHLSFFKDGVFDETALRNTTNRDASESGKLT
jgi:hypothetical protein